MAFKGIILALLLVAICHVNAKSHKKQYIPSVVNPGAVVAPSSLYPSCPCYQSYAATGTACPCAPAVDDIAKKAKDEKKVLVAHLDFETETGGIVKDKTSYGNDAVMHDGAILVNFAKGGCGNAVYAWDGDVLFHGDTFQAKPRYGVTIAAYVLMRKTEGMHELFDTIGQSHGGGQYHFEINDGNVRWFHRDETQKTVFSCDALGGLVKAGDWAHVAGTYDAVTGKAKVYLNGELKNMTVGAGILSRDWAMRAGIGDRKVLRPMNGFIDEFRIYNYALPSAEIKKIATACTGYKPKAPVKVVGSKKKPFFDADTTEVTADQMSDGTDMADTDLLDDTAEVHHNDMNDNLAESEADDTAEPLTDMTDDSHLDHNEETVEEAVLKRSHVNHN